MKHYIVLTFLLVVCLANISSQLAPVVSISALETVSDDNTNNLNADLTGTITTYLVDIVSRKVQTLLEVFDVKLRLVRFLRSLYTTENLTLLRKTLNLSIRFANYISLFIPASTSPVDTSTSILNLFFPQVELEVGSSGSSTPDSSTSSPVSVAVSGPLVPVVPVGPLVPIVGVTYDASNDLEKEDLRNSRSLTDMEKSLIEENGQQAISLHDLLINAGERNRRSL